MTLPRRRPVRPSVAAAPADAGRTRRLQRLRTKLEKERAAPARWMARLKRAFRAVERSQRSVTRIERTLARLEEP